MLYNVFIVAFLRLLYMAVGACPAFEAKEGSQIQVILEHLPPFCRIFCHYPKHHQHLRGIRYLGPREEVEEDI